MVYNVCLHGYTRINKWCLFTWKNKQMFVCLHGYINKWFIGLFTWIYKQMVYEVCLHGYARINKWFTRFVYMDIHE